VQELHTLLGHSLSVEWCVGCGGGVNSTGFGGVWQQVQDGSRLQLVWHQVRDSIASSRQHNVFQPDPSCYKAPIAGLPQYAELQA